MPPRIVIGVTGGIACYKICTVVSRLAQSGGLGGAGGGAEVTEVRGTGYEVRGMNGGRK